MDTLSEGRLEVPLAAQGYGHVLDRLWAQAVGLSESLPFPPSPSSGFREEARRQDVALGLPCRGYSDLEGTLLLH